SRNVWIERPKLSPKPLKNTKIVFTAAGRRKKKAACVWEEGNQWKKHVLVGDEKDSLQTLELKAVVWAFSNWDRVPLNIVSDSLYAVGVVQRLEDALLKRVSNPRLGQLFQ
ncbi:POK19 protein, partial [Callaeas wilsoni]|nr:POK19 protein [Callaeas wilsoni]